ncbi:uncharacterized protein CDAR_120901 [Caerostris darwini]|uniref:Reverse transcriptase domain-containing protein n=1 Tax=Caerostris darwini TaxID=1538125 RepID=A0AAV4Q7Y5_9ARAC|nr:uncharacterized protein CDAR_120901 [Caerostris darwini]
MEDKIDINKLTSGEINDLISKLQESILDSLSTKVNPAHKPSTNNRKRRYTIWWTRQLEIKRSRTRALRRLFQKDPVWKVARVVLLNKDNKELDHPSHFRPICILPCWGKVLDKIICDRLSYHLEADNLLNNGQFGFRKNRSKRFHKISKENNKITLPISIDMSNAFNACYKTVATDSLQVLSGIPPLDTKLRYQQVLHRLKILKEAIQIRDLAIQPNNFSFLKPIIPPWSRCSIKWSIFKQELPGLSIFTDGSKMNGKVGGAFVVFNHHLEVHHQCFRLSDNATVYSAELLAIKEAAEYAILNSLPM